MRRKKHIVHVLTAIVLLQFLLGATCPNPNPCIDAPETDSTPPTARMLISYYEEDDITGKSLELTENDAATTIHTDEAEPVTILYVGQDAEGMKSLHISVTVYKTLGGGGIQQTQHMNIEPVEFGCPKRIAMGTFTLKENLGDRTAKISLRSENWIGLVTNTAQHTINIGN